LGLLTALPGLLLTTLLTALSRLLTLLARLLLSAATLLATLLTALVLLARFLFVRIHKCSFVGLPTDNKTMAIKFPFDFGTHSRVRRHDILARRGVSLSGDPYLSAPHRFIRRGRRPRFARKGWQPRAC
jgi:hypothetical protein